MTRAIEWSGPYNITWRCWFSRLFWVEHFCSRLFCCSLLHRLSGNGYWDLSGAGCCRVVLPGKRGLVYPGEHYPNRGSLPQIIKDLLGHIKDEGYDASNEDGYDKGGTGEAPEKGCPFSIYIIFLLTPRPEIRIMKQWITVIQDMPCFIISHENRFQSNNVWINAPQAKQSLAMKRIYLVFQEKFAKANEIS